MPSTAVRRRHGRPVPAPPLRVVLADGACGFRDGLGFLLRTGGADVVSSVDGAHALLAAVRQHGPDVVVVDAALDGADAAAASGVGAALLLKAERPALGVVVVASRPDARQALRLLDGAPSGAGYLLKEAEKDVLGLLDAVRRVAAGGLALSPGLVAPMLAARGGAEPVSRLGARDREVLALVAQGRSNTGIAETLQLSAKTADSHVAALLRDLGVQHDGTDNGRARAVLALLRAA